MKNKLFLIIILRIILIMTSATVLTSCGKTEILQYANDEEGEQKTQPEDETIETEMAKAPEGKTKEASSVYEISTGKSIDWAILSEGIYCYSDGEYCGYLNARGEHVTPCVYEEAMPFSEGLACVRRDGKYGYIGKDGETALPFVYDQASSFREGVAYFSIGEEYGLIDQEGNVVLELTGCDSISSFREGLAYFSVDGRYGYMDKRGNIVVAPVYDDAGYFYEGVAIVIKDGLAGVIGKDGEEILGPEYIGLRTLDTCIVAQKEDRLYFFDMDGNEVSSTPGNQISKKDDMFYISIDGKVGISDKNGRVIQEPIWEEIRAIPARELVMVRNATGEYGVLDYEGKLVVPFCYYDNVSYFVEDRAVVELDGKHGVLRYDGTLEMPIEYDGIELFSDGSMAVWTGDRVELTDSSGNLILTGEYDYLYESGEGYTTGCYGDGEKFWDRQGNLVSAYQYDLLSSIYGVKNTYLLNDGRLLQRGEEEVPEEVLLTNQITPEVRAFNDIMKGGGADVFDTADTDDMRQWRRYGKLYRMGQESSVVLYFYAEPFRPCTFGLSNSGLYMVRDGMAESVMTASECGGSMGGDCACFWYDTKEGIMKPGTTWHAGGFAGSAYGAKIYEWKQGAIISETSYDCWSQSASNYDVEKLLENAELFYDGEGKTYTKETISEAEHVVEYTVNEEQVSVEDYDEIKKRYICYQPLDISWGK